MIMSVNNKTYFSTFFIVVVFSLIGLAEPAFAQVSSASPDPSSYGMTSGRLVATLAAVLALIGAISGAVALFRPSVRFASIVALAAGLIGAAVGGLRVATASGIGTGGGRAGAIVALVLGLIALVLGGLALSRSRRTG